jgi:hypothetical protein
MWAGSILCGLSVVCVLFISSIDKAIDSAIAVGGGLHAKLNIDDEDEDNEVIVDFPGSEDKDTEEENVGLSSVFSFGVAFWLLAVSCVVVYGMYNIYIYLYYLILYALIVIFYLI